MGVAKKYRRKILIDKRCFFWCVKEDLDWLDVGCQFALSVISEDKHFNISYGIGQDERYRHLISLSKEFPKLSSTKRREPRVGYQRVRCPQWEENLAISPGTVRRIIEWCFTYDPSVIEVNWRGEGSTNSGFLRQTLPD